MNDPGLTLSHWATLTNVTNYQVSYWHCKCNSNSYSKLYGKTKSNTNSNSNLLKLLSYWASHLVSVTRTVVTDWINHWVTLTQYATVHWVQSTHSHSGNFNFNQWPINVHPEPVIDWNS